MSDKQRIARLEQDVERLERVVYWLSEKASRDKLQRAWWPTSGPVAALRRKVLKRGSA